MHVEINETNNNELYAARWEQINKEYAKINGAYTLVDITPETYTSDTFYYLDDNVYKLDTNIAYTTDRDYYTLNKLVNNLADYYANITTIKNLAEGKFLFMPLDEEPIFVNTDTRKLVIPSHFSSNGLSVQGDNHAEMVFFKMPRYFDYHDLARNDLDIGINWQLLTPGKVNVSGSSEAVIIDTTMFPNYVLFGWLITSDMTALKGSIKFAVEVCTKGQLGQQNAEKDFSFNTIPSTLNIAEGLLVPGAPVLTIDAQQAVLNTIIQDSVYTEESLPPLARPVIVTGMQEYTNMPNATTSTDLRVGFYSETLNGASQSASLEYQWVLPNNTIAPGTTIYVQDTSGIFNDKVNYYEQLGENNFKKIIIPDRATYIATTADKDLYLEMTSYTATTPGHYRCIAATKDIVNGKEYKGRSNYNNTTILKAFKPHVNWTPGTNLIEYGDKYIETDTLNKIYYLYADDNINLPITIDVVPLTLTQEKEFVDVTGETIIEKDLTIEADRDYLGQLTYGILNAAETNFISSQTTTTTTKQTLTVENFNDNDEIKLGVKHFKNNDLTTQNTIYTNDGYKFIAYHYPSSIEDLKFTVSTIDGSFSSAIFTLNSQLQLTLNTESTGQLDTYNYVWQDPTYGTYKYIWEYAKKDSGYVAFEESKISYPQNDQTGKTIILTKNSFKDGLKSGDQYSIRLRIECHNKNRTYENTDHTIGIVSQNAIQIVGIVE